MISVNVKFCRKATEVFLVLLVLSLLAAYLCIERAFLDDALLPVGQSVYPWTVVIDSDVLQEGSSSVVINDSTFTVDYTMLLTKDFVTPYGSLRFTFVGPDNEVKKLDLSNYKTISFNVKCSPKNILMYTVYSLDEEVTRRVGDEIYRVANTLFSCDEEWERVEIDLMRLEIVNWWLRAYDVDITERNYTLDRVGGFALSSSEDSPLEVPFNVKITELTFHGYDWRFIYGLGVFLFLLWGSYILWCVRQHTRYLIEDVKNTMQKDNALVTYQFYHAQKGRGQKNGIEFCCKRVYRSGLESGDDGDKAGSKPHEN